MKKIGDYTYPDKVSFAEAIEFTKAAITKYGGKMSNKVAAEQMGYTVKNPRSISGYIFKKFDDVCSYGLMVRERGGLKTTPLAEEALDPYDTRKASAGKAKAIKQMPFVTKAYEEWKGEMPQESAFPAKLRDLLDVSWQEVEKHADTLRKLFIEVFPYINSVSNHEAKQDRADTIGGEKMGSADLKATFIIGQVLGELRTGEYGILKIKDAVSINIARQILRSLEEKIASTTDDKSEKEAT